MLEYKYSRFDKLLKLLKFILCINNSFEFNLYKIKPAQTSLLCKYHYSLLNMIYHATSVYSKHGKHIADFTVNKVRNVLHSAKNDPNGLPNLKSLDRFFEAH